MDLSRRELFLAAAALAGCGGSNEPTIDARRASCVDNGARSIIPYNHGHTLDIPAADITAGTMRSYDITGGADHSHTVTISAADMATLAGNGSIQVMSSIGASHSHTIDIRCR